MWRSLAEIIAQVPPQPVSGRHQESDTINLALFIEKTEEFLQHRLSAHEYRRQLERMDKLVRETLRETQSVSGAAELEGTSLQDLVSNFEGAFLAIARALPAMRSLERPALLRGLEEMRRATTVLQSGHHVLNELSKQSPHDLRDQCRPLYEACDRVSRSELSLELWLRELDRVVSLVEERQAALPDDPAHRSARLALADALSALESMRPYRTSRNSVALNDAWRSFSEALKRFEQNLESED